MNANRIMLEILALFLVVIPAVAVAVVAIGEIRQARARRAIQRQIVRNGMRQQAALDAISKEGRR